MNQPAIKSDEPILIDGMQFEDLKKAFDVPIYAENLFELIRAGLAS